MAAEWGQDYDDFIEVDVDIIELVNGNEKLEGRKRRNKT